MDFTINNAITYIDDSKKIKITVAIPLALFAIKLSRARLKDKVHIIWIMRHGYKPREEDLVEIGVTPEKIEVYRDLLKELDLEEKEESGMGW